MDTIHYACALAYIVGEEARGKGKCTQVETGNHRSTCRLSDRCIGVPAGMPFGAREYFSKILTCVGCRYWSHLQRQANTCDWTPHRRFPWDKPTTLGAANSMQLDREDDSGSSTSESTKSELPPPIPEPSPGRTRRGRRENREARLGDPVMPSEHPDDGAPEMEDWEFTPGKKLDKRERESEFPGPNPSSLGLFSLTHIAAIAFSTSYLTSPQPTVIADDISINRIRMPPGGTQHWPADRSTLRYCEVIEGKVQLKSGGQSFAVGQGGVFVIRPGMACTAENRRYTETVLSCHTNTNYSLMPEEV